jgi:hypothetical protein
VAAVKGMLELILQSTTKKKSSNSNSYCINTVPKMFNLFLKNLLFLNDFPQKIQGCLCQYVILLSEFPIYLLLLSFVYLISYCLCPHSHSIVGRKQGAPVFDQLHVPLVTNIKLVGFNLFQGPEIKLCEVQHRALLYGLMGKWNVLRLI